MPYPTGAIQVTGGIGTTSSTDTYATHYSELGRGGLKSTQDTASRNAIPSDRREFGMEVTLLDSGVKYRLCNEDMGGVDNDKTNNSNWIEVITSIDPSNYDLTDFTNTSLNPFVQQDELDNFIPLTGTEVDKPITGDVFNVNNNEFFFVNEVVSENRQSKFGFIDGDFTAMSNDIDNPNNNDSSVRFIYGNILVDSSDKGIVGEGEFDKQGDRKAFAQISDVEDAIDNLPSFLQLGESSTTAYRGDRGKTAYDHSQTTGNPHQTTLQQVTDEGATTTNPITVGGGLNQVNINDDGTIDATSNITGGKLAVRNIDGELGTILADNLTDDREYQLQDKDGTLALIEDIPSQLNPTAGTGMSITGTYPNLTFTNTSPNVAQDLHQTTTIGATTSNTITVGNTSADYTELSGAGLNVTRGGDVEATKISKDYIRFYQGTGGGGYYNELKRANSGLLSNATHYFQSKGGTIAHVDDILSDAVDIDYDNTASGLDATNVQEAVDEIVENISKAGFAQRTGTEIHFDKWATYDSYSSPSDGNYSYDLTNAVIGMIQVSYHEDTVVPTFSQAGIDVIIVGEYQPNIVNKIMFELIGATRVLINILPL